MRIIGGENRGMLLKTPKGLRVRPTADRVKEALFNIIGTSIIDTRILDIFAGTGNLGLEALSRGAKQVCFVDNHRESAAIISENICKTKRGSQTRVLQLDCMAALNVLRKNAESFDYIFCDPPYNCGWPDKIISNLSAGGLLASSGIIIIEHSIDEEITACGNLKLLDARKYGDTKVSFFGGNTCV